MNGKSLISVLVVGALTLALVPSQEVSYLNELSLAKDVSGSKARNEARIADQGTISNRVKYVPARKPKPSRKITSLVVTRSGNRAVVQVHGIREKARATWKVGRKSYKKNSKRMKWNKTWKFSISRKAKKLTVTGPGFAPLSLKVPRGGWQSIGTDSFNPIKPFGGKKTSWRYLRIDGGGVPRIDPCTYTLKPGEDSWRPEIVASAKKTKTAVTWRLPKNARYTGDIRASFKKLDPYVDWTFREVAWNQPADIKITDTEVTNDFSMNGNAFLGSTTGMNTSKVLTKVREIWLQLSKKATPGTRRHLIMHEIMHTLGLDHVKDDQQIMQAITPWGTPAYIGAGDREGLKQIGHSRGCIFQPGDEYPIWYE